MASSAIVRSSPSTNQCHHCGENMSCSPVDSSADRPRQSAPVHKRAVCSRRSHAWRCLRIRRQNGVAGKLGTGPDARLGGLTVTKATEAATFTTARRRCFDSRRSHTGSRCRRKWHHLVRPRPARPAREFRFQARCPSGRGRCSGGMLRSMGTCCFWFHAGLPCRLRPPVRARAACRHSRGSG